MGKMWDPRWVDKEKLLKASGSEWRSNRALMHGIQSEPDKADTERWVRVCRDAGVPEQYWDDTAVGGPITFEIGAHHVNPGSVRHAYTAHRIMSHYKDPEKLPYCVVEIGGGYGGLARALSQRTGIYNYIMVDNPVCLEIQRRFMEQACPDICYTSYATPEEFGSLSNYDLVINQNSFGEMDPSEVEAYFHIMQNTMKPGGNLYVVNRIKRQTPLAKYPFDDRWNHEIQNWISDRYWFELWSERTKQGLGDRARPLTFKGK